MSQVKIVSAYENYERILASYAGDLRQFVTALDELVVESEGIISSLKSYWKGDSYDKFASVARRDFHEIRGGMELIGEVRSAIDQKISELEAYIRLLRGEA